MNHHGYVGPFFFIQGSVYSGAAPIANAAQNLFGKYDVPTSHLKLYASSIQPTLSFLDALHPYDYWPRGRIVYNALSDVFEVYLDRCLIDEESARKKIIKAFRLEGETVLWEGDDHYLCHRCNPDFVDYD